MTARVGAGTGKSCVWCRAVTTGKAGLVDARGNHWCPGCWAAQKPKAATPPAASGPEPAEPYRPSDADHSVLQPGEVDCFFDTSALVLIRRQIAPEPLLAACNAHRSVAEGIHAVVVTPSKFLVFRCKTENGQTALCDRREVALANVDHVSLKSDEKSVVNRRVKHTLQLVIGDRIENWVSEYSSLGRVGTAILDVKAGRDVRPFIRTSDDLTVWRARAAAPPPVPPPPPPPPPGRAERVLARAGITLKPASARGRAREVVLVLVLGIPVMFGVIMAVTDATSRHQWNSTSPGSTSSSSSGKALPTIKVTNMLHGGPASAVQFSDWQATFFGIKGRAVWTSGLVDAITYTVREDGVVKNRSTLNIPGGTLKRDEPVEVEINLPGNHYETLEVTIEVEE